MNFTGTYHQARPNTAGFFFLMIVSFIAFGIALVIAMPKFVEGKHAETVHGADAYQARNVCKTYGINQIWQQKDGRLHWLCQSPTDGWYDVIATKVDGVWREVSAFKPKDGTLSTIVSWIKSKGAKWVPIETFRP